MMAVLVFWRSWLSRRCSTVPAGASQFCCLLFCCPLVDLEGVPFQCNCVPVCGPAVGRLGGGPVAGLLGLEGGAEGLGGGPEGLEGGAPGRGGFFVEGSLSIDRYVDGE